MTIALIDYGIGNLRSVRKALETAGGAVFQTDDPEEILAADKVILPGVGSFRDGMGGLKERGLISVLEEIRERNTPLLGICLGMQLIFEASMEMGHCPGLRFVRGQVRPFPASALKVPQTGWNQLEMVNNSSLLTGIPNGSYVYFNHGYYCAPENPEDVIALTDYGVAYASAIQSRALYGVQFHPEKSQSIGLAILRNFLEVDS